MNLLLIFLLTLSTKYVPISHSAKVLGVFPTAFYSHFILGDALMRELAQRGHEVTVISPFPTRSPLKNYRSVSTEEFVPLANEKMGNLFEALDKSIWEHLSLICKHGKVLSEFTLSNKRVQDLLNSGETFDAVIVEQFFDEALMGLGYHFKTPIILFSSGGSILWNNDLVGNAAPSSYNPNLLTRYTNQMTFLQRLKNISFDVITRLYRWYIMFPIQNKILKTYIPNAPHLTEVIYNASLLLLNSHVSVLEPVSHVPSMIEIGGFHVRSPKTLPEHFQTFLDKAEEGVILFSMGSCLKSVNLHPEKRNIILQTFSKLKQKILWKWEDDYLPEQPSNVKLEKWLPQQDILAHPNIRAFISHGGLLSTTEAVYHGVPLIGIPIYADQKMNIDVAASNGYAIRVSFVELSLEKLSWALNEIINKTKYRENAQRRSKILHDQPIKPIDNAVFWIEHVIRHNGAPHLRSAALDLSWYQYHLLDVYAFIIGATIVFLVLIFYVIRKIKTYISIAKSKARKSE